MKDARLQELVDEINKSGEWIPDLLEELCELADMAEEWEAAGGDFENVVYAAAEKLGVEI